MNGRYNPICKFLFRFGDLLNRRETALADSLMMNIRPMMRRLSSVSREKLRPLYPVTISSPPMRGHGHPAAELKPNRAVSASDRASASDIICRRLETELGSMRERGTYKSERVITSPMEPTMHVLSGRQSQPSEVINFCANNYLGLSNHPRLIEAARATLDSHGVGMSSVRFICGTQDIHKRLEAAIADFHGTEEAIVYPSCFDANAGVFESLLGPEDAIVSDALNHASIIDGIRLCKAQRLRYNHADMDDLEAKLRQTQGARHRQKSLTAFFPICHTLFFLYITGSGLQADSHRWCLLNGR